MKKLVALAALGTALAVAIPAQAASLDLGIRTGNVAVVFRDHPGYHGYRETESWRHHRWMEREEITQRIYRMGYVRIYDLDRDGDIYRARVVNRRGVIFALTLNAWDGGVRTADIVGREHFWRG